jgi:hypothetical protein
MAAGITGGHLFFDFACPGALRTSTAYGQTSDTLLGGWVRRMG